MKVVESSLVPCLANIGFSSGGNSHSVASFWALVFSMNILGLKLDCVFGPCDNHPFPHVLH